MFCKKCNQQINEGSRFCTYCGSPVDESFSANQGNYGAKSLNYKIFGGSFPAVSIRLNTNESIYTQAGGMTWMDTGITMETNMQGGFMKGLGRMLSGESLFMATYTSHAPNQEIVIASTFPGCILDIDIGRCPIIAQKSAFLCAQPTVELSTYIARGLKAGLIKI